jgi:hypothetical protein
MRLRQLWLAAILVPAALAAQPAAISSRPDRLAVTVYRDPYSNGDNPLNRQWLNGYALISETRRVSIPAGEAELRFEGVAGGMLPQSAIVSGLSDAILERNRDAYLLSPGTLLDRSLGRRVHLSRTSKATGKTVEQEAIVRSGADGAVILQTPQGYESLRCTGLSETLIYDRVPPGLSAKPTLSVRTRSDRPLTTDVTLSYLATGFDWRANYIAILSPAGDRLELSAWLTLASSDETSFPAAQTQTVAGRLNWTGVRAPRSEWRPLTLTCWPQSSTSDIPEQSQEIVVTGSRVMAREMDQFSNAAPPPPPPPPMMAPAAMMAQQEALGALKLYHIPEPVTVAANSQKQVAFLARPSVRVRSVYRRPIFGAEDSVPMVARRVLVTSNVEANGLGLPLPAGQVVIFSSGGSRPILIGEGAVGDHAVGEEVEFALGDTPGVLSRLRLLKRSAERSEFELTVTSDRPTPIRFESEIWMPGGRFEAEVPLGRRNGRPLIALTVPANGSAAMRFSVLPR